MVTVLRTIVGLVLLFFMASSHAVTLSFTVEELIQRLNEARNSGNPLSQALAQKIGDYLAEQNVSISPSTVTISQPIEQNSIPWNVCDNPPLFGLDKPDPIAGGLKRGYVTGTINTQNSSLTLSVQGRRVSAYVLLHGSVTADTRAFITWTFKIPNPLTLKYECLVPWNDDVDIFANIYLKAKATLVMDVLNTSVSANTITIRNNFNLSGDVELPNTMNNGLLNPEIRIGDDFRVNSVSELLFRQIIYGREFHPFVWHATKKGFIDYFAKDFYEKTLIKQQEALRLQYGTYDIEVSFPPMDDERVIAAIQDYLETHYGFRDHPGVVNALYSFIRANLVEILFALLTDDQDALERVMVGAGCEVLKTVETNFVPPSLYTRRLGLMCIAADPFGPDAGDYYSDNLCKTPILYKPPRREEYCRDLFGRRPNTTLGNAGAISSDEVTPWTVSFSNRLAITAEPNSVSSQPFMTRVNYLTTQKPLGSGAFLDRKCSLEMRVYKKNPTATGLQPILAIHGGSWKYRAPFFALDASIPYYTDAGFVVFAPFYRLVGDADGSTGCNGATWRDVVSDIEAAVDWVKANQESYGAIAGEPIAVIGQSAGAHLADWLVSHRPSDISRGLLLYPPTDLLDFLQNRTGAYASYNNADTVGTLSDFFGTDVTMADTSNPPDFVLKNSFTRWIKSTTPPVFLVHGIADELIPSNQSVVLCNSYGGAALNSGGGVNLRAVYNCGVGFLHLFQQGRHGLDGCIRGQTGGAASSLCLSGGEASADLVGDSLRQGREWLRAGLRPPTNCGTRWCQ